MSSIGITENATLKQLIYPKLQLYPCLRWVMVMATTSDDAEDYSAAKTELMTPDNFYQISNNNSNNLFLHRQSLIVLMI